MRPIKPAPVVAAALVVIATITVLAFNTGFEEVHDVVQGDNSVHNWFVNHRVGWITPLMKVLTDAAAWGTVVVLVIVGMVVAFRRKRCGDAAFLLLANLGGYLVGTVMKLTINRARPDSVDRVVQVATASFPSGHSLQSVLCYGAFAIVFWRWGWLGKRVTPVVAAVVIIAGAIGFSRIYLGVHWPSDVAAGWLVGSSWLAISWAITSTVRTRRSTSRDQAVA